MSKKFMIGLGLAVIVLIAGLSLGDNYVRLVAGMFMGYALTRGFFGFAGSINRPANFGTTKLAQTLMLMFFGVSVVMAAVLYGTGVENYAINVNPINLGLIIGGIIFGIGMAFATCCASGVLTDIIATPIRGLIILTFFGMGVFLGLGMQSTLPWVTGTIVSTSTFAGRGVFFPDLVNGPLNGYLFAVVLTGILSIITVVIARNWEAKNKDKFECACAPEVLQEQREENVTLFEKIFVKPFTMNGAAAAVGIAALVIFFIGKNPWGVSTTFGFWFAKLLMVFGVEVSTLVEMTGKAPEFFTVGILQNGGSVQNIGLIIGALCAALMMGRFNPNLNLTKRDAIILPIGGLLMGLGTRLANGCNAGALFSGIISFSLSGWIFLIVMAIGGIIGNMILKSLK